VTTESLALRAEQARDAARNAQALAESAAQSAEETIGSMVRYDISQTKTDVEKARARGNIGASAGDMAEDFSTSKAYAIGDYVVYNSKIWKFTVAHSAGAWNSS